MNGWKSRSLLKFYISKETEFFSSLKLSILENDESGSFKIRQSCLDSTSKEVKEKVFRNKFIKQFFNIVIEIIILSLFSLFSSSL